MKYMVMECGLSYAIVLDEEGRFLKVPNMDYEVGQTVEHIIQFSDVETTKQRSFLQRHIHRLTAAAACFCLIVVGSQQFLFSTYGTVRMQINPDVLLSVNRLDYVTEIEGLNADGVNLIDAYRSFGKKVDVVSDELSVLAMEKGYLDENGQIRFTVESEHEDWKRATEEILITTISVHLPESINVQIAGTKTEISIPVYDETENRYDDDWENDDRNDDDWDDDEWDDDDRYDVDWDDDDWDDDDWDDDDLDDDDWDDDDWDDDDRDDDDRDDDDWDDDDWDDDDD